MRFDDFIEDYTRRQKHRTATVYFRLLSPFDKWLDQQRLTTFDREDVLNFIESRKWGNSSKNTFLSALRSWAKDSLTKITLGPTTEEVRAALLEQSKLSRLVALKGYTLDAKLTYSLTLEQITELLEVMPPDDYVISWLYLWFGFRLEELGHIVSVDREKQQLTVETEKTRNIKAHRTLYFDKFTEGILNYAEEKGLMNLPPNTIWRMISKYSSYTAPNRLTPKVLRHTFSSHFRKLIDRDIRRVMMGHGIEAAIDTYTHPFEEEIRLAMIEKHYLKSLEKTKEV